MSNRNQQNKQSNKENKAPVVPEGEVKDVSVQEQPEKVQSVDQPKQEDTPKEPVKQATVSSPTIAATHKYNSTNQVVAILEDYVESMRLNRSIDTATGVMCQRNLINLLTKFLLNRKWEEFEEGMSAVMVFVKEHRDTIFSSKAIFRFVPDLTNVTTGQVEMFKDMCVVLQKINDGGIDVAKKQVDVEKVISRVNNENAISNLTRYLKM